MNNCINVLGQQDVSNSTTVYFISTGNNFIEHGSELFTIVVIGKGDSISRGWLDHGVYNSYSYDTAREEYIHWIELLSS